MAKVKRLNPRIKWTNRIAWTVWKIAQNNKKRSSGSGSGGELFSNGMLQATGVLQTDTILGLP